MKFPWVGVLGFRGLGVKVQLRVPLKVPLRAPLRGLIGCMGLGGVGS